MSEKGAQHGSVDEAVRDFHFAYFKTEWTTRSEGAFQEFFESIMTRAYATFVPVVPAGSHGDKKSDGYRTDDQTIFQVYAPSSGLKSARTCAKIQTDFDGARVQWPAMERWIFVWSTPRLGLPPDAAALIGALDAAHETIRVREWGRDRLWRVVRELAEDDRNEILRAFPSINRTSHAAVTADVSSLLNSVSSMPQVAASDSLALTPPKAKLNKNRLGPTTEWLVQNAMALVPTVKHVSLQHPDPGFGDRVASALRGLYEARAAESDDPDVLFLRLVKDVAGDATDDEDRFWAAAAIVTRSFEICDVFEP